MLASYVYSTDTIADRHIQQEGRNTNTEGNAGDAALVRGLDQDMEAMTDVAILRNARKDQQGSLSLDIPGRSTAHRHRYQRWHTLLHYVCWQVEGRVVLGVTIAKRRRR